MGLLSTIAELDRARAARDSNFYKSMLYYFELKVPESIGAPGNYLYPLILPPEALRMSEPFQVGLTYTNGGGVFVEEQGITTREITISGSTGWRPRRQNKPVSNFSSLGFANNKSYTRNNATSDNLLVALSGQRHFQFLQDTVFRTYADLKQDPATSAGTELYFHNTKDDEHWRVIPRAFSLSRDAARPLEYMYEITLTAVQATKVGTQAPGEDHGVLNTLKDSTRVLRTATSNIRAAIADISAVQGELRQTYGGFVAFLDGTVAIVEATEALVDGSATLIQQPFQLLENTVASGLDALLELTTGIRQTTGVGAPANLLNSLRKIHDGLAMIGSYPEHFTNSTQEAVARYQARQSLANRSQASLTAAENSNPPQSIREFDSMGSGLWPGDAARAREDLGLGRFAPAFQSAWEWLVEQGDTLANLAARFLGDARHWKHIAVFNNLQAPYISEEGLPGTLTIGDKILIPSLSPPPGVRGNVATYGVRPEESPRVHSLGRDLRMDPVRDSWQYDLVIDEEGGSVDVKLVEGVPNLTQAIRSRIITERGTDTLYKTLGTSRLVGLGVAEVDLETARYRLASSIQEDPRINAIRSLAFDTPQPDSVVADVVAEVRGFTRPERIQVTAPAT